MKKQNHWGRMLVALAFVVSMAYWATHTNAGTPSLRAYVDAVYAAQEAQACKAAEVR